MILTNKQEQGLKEAVRRYRNGDRYVVISGYAGSGKSTLVRYIIEALNVPEDEIAYATFTGKAAQVLAQKGNSNAITLHRLLYKSYQTEDGTFKRTPRMTLEPYKVVVVDEISMVPTEMVKLLARHRCFFIFLGDPGQLPPIFASDDNHLLDSPHVFLDEIMRQAQESEIIRLTMDIRAGKPLRPMVGKEVCVFKKTDYDESMLTWADQVICATNEKRLELNNQMRAKLGHCGSPQEGDKVICLHNYWDSCGSEGNPIVNGTIGYLKNPYNTFIQYPYYLGGGRRFDMVHTELITDAGEEFDGLNLDTKLIMTGNKCCDDQTAYKINRVKKYKGTLPLEFSYGYAVTCHKAQGSEWEKVLVFEEGHPYSREEHQKWLYTAATRASKKLVLIKK